MESYLRELLSSRQTLSWHHPEPKKLAYKLHEAIAAAKENPRFRVYADLRAFYRIKTESTKVVAYWIGESPIPEEPASPPSKVPTLTISDPLSINGILGAAIKFSDNPEIYFSNPILRDDDLTKLYRWTSQTKWHIINHGEAGITLSKNVREELQWKPQP